MRVTPVTFDPGTVIIREGDEPQGIFIIEAGDVQVYSDNDGTKTHIAKLVRGQIFGELAIIENIPHTRSVRALTIVDCLWIEPHEFKQLIDDTPKLVQMVLKRVVKKLHRTNAIAYGAEKPRDKSPKL